MLQRSPWLTKHNRSRLKIWIACPFHVISAYRRPNRFSISEGPNVHESSYDRTCSQLELKQNRLYASFSYCQESSQSTQPTSFKYAKFWYDQIFWSISSAHTPQICRILVWPRCSHSAFMNIQTCTNLHYDRSGGQSALQIRLKRLFASFSYGQEFNQPTLPTLRKYAELSHSQNKGPSAMPALLKYAEFS